MDALEEAQEQHYAPSPCAMDAEDDAYADLEQWYAASLPHLRSAASFAHMADAFASARQQPTPSTDDAVAEAVDADGFVDEDGDYAIDFDDNDDDSLVLSAPPFHETVSPDPAPNPTVLPNDDDDDDNRFLSFVPKKLRARQCNETGECVGDATARARCCDKCRSDLNGKLLATCATCAFRRHLYCFAPPLRQQPALATLTHVPRHKRLPMGTLVAQWRCDDCVARLGSAPSPEAPRRRGPKPVTTGSPPRPAHKLNPKTSLVKPVHSAPAPSTAGPFDWHAFRADKLAKISGQEEAPRDEEEPVLLFQQLRAELAFYSPTDALLRKTARFWQLHVRRRRQERAQHGARRLKCELPPKRPQLRAVVSPREAAEAAEAHQRHQQDEDQRERALLDDSRYYPVNDTRPVFETLRWRPPPAVEAVADSDGNGRGHEERALREACESQRMEQEDDDAPTPAQAARIARRHALAAAITDDPSLRGLSLAVRIVERACVRWLGRTRQRVRGALTLAAQRQRDREHDDLQRMRAEESEQRQRRERARRLLLRLRYQIMFIRSLVRAQRRVAVKKQLVGLLIDTTKDRAGTRPPPRDAADDEGARRDQRQRLARRRIQRFFLRRVRQYIRLKQRVLAWRIARWWKWRHNATRFRWLALRARHVRRDLAARHIQRAYRAFRVYQTFCALRRKHVLRRLARFLRGWLLRRLARQERDRVAVYDALCALTGDTTLVPAHAPRHALLRALGLVLVERRDFWHAAALLERAAALRCERVGADREAGFALAYSHHQSWYTSGDPSQLEKAEQGYRALLTSDGAKDGFVLQELAVVLMHREAFRTSLALLATLIEGVRTGDNDGFPLWLLLAGVQLAQLGEYAQSASYLSYLVDLALPAPYVERDVLALCAISYEKTDGETARSTAREAWRAAVRLWTVEKKLVHGVRGSDSAVVPHPHLDHVSSNKHEMRAQSSAQRKWALLVDLAQRASQSGHYLVACQTLLYALERLAPAVADDGETKHQQQRAWWLLGDAFRRLGRLELFVEATARSRETVSDAERARWRADAETNAQCFQHELQTLSPGACVAQVRALYKARRNDLQLEDVLDDVEVG